MRYSLPAALVAILFSVQAAAQDDENEKKKGDEAAAGSLDGNDPVDEETSDDGRFAPKGKTGKLKEKKKKEKEKKVEEIPRKKINAFADILYVWGTPPDVDKQSTYSSDESVKAYGFVLGGTYDVDDKFSIGLRIPFSRSDLDAERLDQIVFDGTSNALGNPEIIAQYRLKRAPGVFIPLDFGIGAPFGQGDPDPTSANHPAAAKAMTNRTMDAGTGWHDSELYYVGRVPVKVGVGYLRERVTWNVYANTKVIAAPKVRGALETEDPSDPETEEYKYNPVALRNITAIGGAGNVIAGLWLGAEGWLGINIIEEIDRVSDATPPSAFQFVVEPKLSYDFEFMKVGLSYIKPLGGRLRDIQGARLGIDVGF